MIRRKEREREIGSRLLPVRSSVSERRFLQSVSRPPKRPALLPARTKSRFSHGGNEKSRGAPPSRRNQFSATRKAGSRQLVATVSSSGDYLLSLSRSVSLSDPRGIIRGDSGRRSPRKKTDPPRGVEVSRVRKGCESSSCLCSCCTPWCLRGPFVSDYGFLSPGPSLHPCKEEGRKGGSAGRANVDAGL